MLRNYHNGASLALIAGLICGGCTKTRVATVGRMDAPKTEVLQPVRYDGEYVAKWTPSDRKKLKTIPNSTRYVHAGDMLGFKRGPDGQLIAMHGETALPL